MEKNLVAIPVYNEAAHIRPLLHEIRCYYQGDILFVDDGSSDTSSEVLDDVSGMAVRILQHQENQGYGASLIDSFSYAAQNKYSVLLTMDCDWQHEPALIPDFFAKIRERDVLSGSRYLFSADKSPAPADRKNINEKITPIINTITGYQLTDAFCGFKAYRVAALKKLALTEKGYAFPLQFWIQAACFKLKVEELAVPRIYPVPSRTFGGKLDNPEVRLKHYLSVIEKEKAQWKIP
jgi:glycosyltransferase involved in cell wall biosynthesis